MDTERKAQIFSRELSGLELSNKSFLFLEPAARSPRLAITLTNIGWMIIKTARTNTLFHEV
jgi:hypothetical protein